MKKSRPSPPDRRISHCLQVAVGVLDDTKAEKVAVLDLRAVTSMTDYFLVCTGTSERHLQALAEHVEAALKLETCRPLSIEGLARAQWVLMDYGDFVLHLFLDDTRRFYRLENLWGDAPDVVEEYRSAAAR